MFGWHLVQVFTHLAVFRHRLYLKDVAQVAELFFFFDSSLELQQGGVLKKHHGKSTHQAIMQAVVDLTILAAVIEIAEMF